MIGRRFRSEGASCPYRDFQGSYIAGLVTCISCDSIVLVHLLLAHTVVLVHLLLPACLTGLQVCSVMDAAYIIISCADMGGLALGWLCDALQSLMDEHDEVTSRPAKVMRL